MSNTPSLLPCPFCGAAAHFKMDADRWEWIECESCGMQGNRSASLMEDCRTKLADAWNRRAHLAAPPQEMSPDFTDTARAALLWVLWHHQGGSSPVGQPIRFALGIGQYDRMNEHQLYEAKRWERLHPVNPSVWAQKQDPLTDEQIEREWQFLHDEEGNHPDHSDFARAIERAHGIGIKKGDSHGLPT